MAKPTIYTQEMIEKYTKVGYWEPTTTSDYWEINARQYPDREALVDARVRLTWAQAKVWIDRLALGLLEMGFRRDQVLVIQLANCAELVLLRVACERAGLLCLPVLRTFRHTEMEHVLGYTEAAGVVIPWKYRGFDYYAMVQELKPNLAALKHIFVVGDDVPPGTVSLRRMLENPLEKKYPPDYLEGKKYSALEYSLIGLTTGTTGAPKFVESPICARICDKILFEALKAKSGDTVGALSPAAQGPNAAMYYFGPQAGLRAVLLDHWSVEEGLELIQKERITIPCVVPTQLAEIAAYPHLGKYDLSSVRTFYCTGAALPYAVSVDIEAKLGKPIAQTYGSVDFGPISMVFMDDPREVRLLTVGRPYYGNEIKLVDGSGQGVGQDQVGEIVVRGPTGASGFFKDPEATARTWTKDGWFRTGDLGKWDKQGYLTIAGREKDMIIRGGQNIYPQEVENLLLAHPGVADAAIVSIPDAIMGERACACLVPKPDQTIAFEEMVSFLKTKKIAAYKLPEKLVLLDSLPYVGGLKLDRKSLRASIIERLKAQGEI